MIDCIKVLCGPGKAVGENSVQVKWSSDYSMKIHPTEKDSIENVWREKSKQNIRLYDASKFRLHGMKEIYKDNESLPTINFLLGTTSYKEYIGTNFAPYAQQLATDGILNFGDSQAYMADPLGVGSILETSDQKLVFIKRSYTCAVMQGMIDRPGGHPEPEDILNNAKNASFEHIDSSLITQEIFSSVHKEIRDEVNIPIKNLSPPLLLGIFYNPETFKGPSLEFYVSCDLSSEVVQEMYSQQTQAECYESTDLIVIPLSEVLKIGKLRDGDFWNLLTPTARCALALLCIFYS